MKIAVITPYLNETMSFLERAHQSVVKQSMACEHIMVADGNPRAEIDTWDCQHIKLPNAHEDAGNLARGLGGLHALNIGCDYVAFLDADNWFEADHVRSLVELSLNAKTCVTTSARNMVRPDGTIRTGGIDHSNGKTMADTNTLLFHRQAYDLVSLWATLPKEARYVGDEILWSAVLSRRYATAHTGRATLNYQMRGYTDTEWAVEKARRQQVTAAFNTQNSTAERKRIVTGLRDSPANSPEIRIEA